MNLIEAKLVTISVLGLVSIVCGLIPIPVVRKLGWASASGMSTRARTILSAVLCFGGGVLMGVGFLHMLPEVNEGWKHYVEAHNIDIHLDLGIVVVCCGFFLVYLVEEVAHLVVDRHAHSKADVSLHRAVSVRACPVAQSPPCSAVLSEQSDEVKPCEDKSICHLDCDNKEFCTGAKDAELSDAPASPAHQGNLVTAAIPMAKSERYGTFTFPSDDSGHNAHADHDHEPRLASKNAVYGTRAQAGIGAAPPHRHDQHHHHGLVPASGGSPNVHGLFIVVALSLHEILEGMAIGLQGDQSGVLQMFVAVASHKYVISFCVGLELAANNVRLVVHVVYILTFSLVTPIGAAIGIAITSVHADGDASDSVGALVMYGLACGTVLYVAFFEILERERAKSTVGLLQWFLLVLGFLAMAGLQSQGV